MSTTSGTRVLQRIVFPLVPEQDILPLYTEGNMGQPVTTVGSDGKERSTHSAPAEAQEAAQVLSRRSFRVKPSRRTSFGTYFNAFPASYWRRWTVVDEVTLRVVVSGAGTVSVYRSNARGNIYRVEGVQFRDASAKELCFRLPLASFADGGWYWFDMIAAEEGAVLDSGQWEAATDREQGTVTIGICTLNRPDDVVELLGQLAADDALTEILDQVTVVDQGTQHPDDAEGFAGARDALGRRLVMIRQANLGGSGGFSRCMSETLDAGRSTYHLISDDDVRAEPEGILRAVTFADLARRPTIVGGHMFSMFDRAFLHSMGERINPWRFWWGPAIEETAGHHLNESSLRSTPTLHRRIDVDYNGWWMTLIPVDVLRRVGLSLPLFIKWDDAEYGLRAREAGVPTVTLPGMAVWHVPWTDKDDSIDWQSYYHQRNRFVAALLHSPFRYGGRLVRESFYIQLKHLLSAQYSAAELRLQALDDLLSGPEHLHADLDTRLGRIREFRAGYDDARIEREPGVFPMVRRQKVSKRGDAVRLPDGKFGTYAMAMAGLLKALRPVSDFSRQHPEAEVAAMDAKWWMLSQFDSAVVSTADGSGSAWYKRQPEEFRKLVQRSLDTHQRVLREWPRLAEEYKAALPELVGQEAWKKTFARTELTQQ